MKKLHEIKRSIVWHLGWWSLTSVSQCVPYSLHWQIFLYLQYPDWGSEWFSFPLPAWESGGEGTATPLCSLCTCLSIQYCMAIEIKLSFKSLVWEEFSLVYFMLMLLIRKNCRLLYRNVLLLFKVPMFVLLKSNLGSFLSLIPAIPKNPGW